MDYYTENGSASQSPDKGRREENLAVPHNALAEVSFYIIFMVETMLR